MSFLQKHAKKPSFVSYAESAKTPLRPDLIVAQKDLVRDAKRTIDTMCFSIKTLRKVLEEIHSEKRNADDPSWNLSDDKVESWALKNAHRLQSLFRHVRQAEVKQSKAPWFRLVFPDDEATAPPVKTEYVYGYNREVETAWRALADAPERKEWASSHWAPADAAASAATRAKWDDGDEHDVTECTCEEKRKKDAHAKADARKKRSSLFEGFKGKSKVKLAWRTDRGMLISLYRDGHQICQMKPAALVLPNQEQTAEQAAQKIMLKVTQDYMAEEVEENRLYDRRDMLMKSSGITFARNGKVKTDGEPTKRRRVTFKRGDPAKEAAAARNSSQANAKNTETQEVGKEDPAKDDPTEDTENMPENVKLETATLCTSAMADDASALVPASAQQDGGQRI